jgi:hypothetical protein
LSQRGDDPSILARRRLHARAGRRSARPGRRGSSLNEKAVGDHGEAFGLHHWRTARIDAIRNGCGIDLKKAPPLADQLKASRTAYDAGYAACRFWERPGATAQFGKRGATAEKWAVFFSKTRFEDSNDARSNRRSALQS